MLGPHRVAVVEQPAIGRTAGRLPVRHEERWRLAVHVGPGRSRRLFADQGVDEVALKSLVDVQIVEHRGPVVEEVTRVPDDLFVERLVRHSPETSAPNAGLNPLPSAQSSDASYRVRR